MAGQIINAEVHQRNAHNTGVGHTWNPEAKPDSVHRPIGRIKIGGKQNGFHGKDHFRMVQDYPLRKGLSMTRVISAADF